MPAMDFFCGWTRFLIVYISVAAAVTADYGFALTARHFFQTPKKYPKRLAPSVRPSLRLGVPSLRAHGAGPERGHAEPQRGTERQGQEPLVTWGFFK
ncbi:hypothetical protein FQ185_18000 [Pseudomonas sp. ANT_H12B]|nr:hypothetical protein FQ185_18000 [Pseudomonas sp. ANT_H12B]